MEKKELKQHVIAIYKRVFGTDKTPDHFDIAKLANIMAIAVRRSSDAEKELGKEFVDIIKRNTKIHRNDVEVKLSNILNEIDW